MRLRSPVGGGVRATAAYRPLLRFLGDDRVLTAAEEEAETSEQAPGLWGGGGGWGRWSRRCGWRAREKGGQR